VPVLSMIIFAILILSRKLFSQGTRENLPNLDVS
jgi:hypothetical protein